MGRAQRLLRRLALGHVVDDRDAADVAAAGAQDCARHRLGPANRAVLPEIAPLEAIARYLATPQALQVLARRRPVFLVDQRVRLDPTQLLERVADEVQIAPVGAQHALVLAPADDAGAGILENGAEIGFALGKLLLALGELAGVT